MAIAHRRLKRSPAALEITGFLNLIVVLVPFLLSTAVFTRLSVLDMQLPAAADKTLQQIEPGRLQLEVVVRADAVEVGDRIGGLIQRLPRSERGHDLASLQALMVQIKQRFPDHTAATVLPEPEVPYEQLVHVMDSVRQANTAQGAKVVRVDLFPQIAIGDAPTRVAQK